MRVKLYDGKLLCTSSYEFRVFATSTNAALLGFDLSPAILHRVCPTHSTAAMQGSQVSIGIPTGPNEKLYIAGQSPGAHQITSTAGPALME